MNLSSDDQPVLSALAAGHITITAGTASADAFAFQEGGTVQAITSDGATAWTADVSKVVWWEPGYMLPDFQGSSGANDNIDVYNWVSVYNPNGPMAYNINMITNADQGILLSWDSFHESTEYSTRHAHMATISGASASVVDSSPHSVVPILQLQDGSFVGTASDMTGETQYMIAFDASGGLRWSVSGYTPQIATADGGLIATSDSGSAVMFDRNGSATGQMASLLTQSWRGNSYQIGTVNRVVSLLLDFSASFWTLAGGQYTFGTGAIPIDSISNNKVKNLLTPARWRVFATSNCGVVFGHPLGVPSMIPNYSLQMVQKKQDMTNFYDVGNPGVGALPLRAVTGGQYGSIVRLTDYLQNSGATAATANMGYNRQTAVVLSPTVFSQPYPQFTLVHELLFHAYAAQSDDMIFGNAFFAAQGLWRPVGSTATVNISTWMSTDCTCTPGKPGTTCQANTAQW